MVNGGELMAIQVVCVDCGSARTIYNRRRVPERCLACAKKRAAQTWNPYHGPSRARHKGARPYSKSFIDYITK